jgi:hypothetical protein
MWLYGLCVRVAHAYRVNLVKFPLQALRQGRLEEERRKSSLHGRRGVWRHHQGSGFQRRRFVPSLARCASMAGTTNG